MISEDETCAITNPSQTRGKHFLRKIILNMLNTIRKLNKNQNSKNKSGLTGVELGVGNFEGLRNTQDFEQFMKVVLISFLINIMKKKTFWYNMVGFH